ncbi:MAG: helix-turn-helix domain-containing protein [Candidatus Competibacteraceae bacterium]|nr:helix-turn-helix domain-containing protein [Candidatus Competibacteraceae bacterium]
MSARAAFPEGSPDVLAALRREVKTKAEFQRVQAVWPRVTVGLSDEQIAQAVGLSAHTVRCLSSRFRCQGASALTGTGRGGRRHENLTVAQEQALLQPFLDPAGQGHLLQINPIKTAYEPVVGHPVPRSTIDRRLRRHGWRKLAPRPRHPKAVSAQHRRLKKRPARVQDAVRNPARQGRPVRLMFQDEARFGRSSDPRRCWAPPGVRPVVGAPVVCQYTDAFAAVSPHDGTLDALILP